MKLGNPRDVRNSPAGDIQKRNGQIRWGLAIGPIRPPLPRLFKANSQENRPVKLPDSAARILLPIELSRCHFCSLMIDPPGPDAYKWPTGADGAPGDQKPPRTSLCFILYPMGSWLSKGGCGESGDRV